MVQIISSSSFNPANLQAPDLYIETVPPPPFMAGVPTDVVGVVGTASWGPVNSPQLLGSPQAATQTFGRVGSAALTDVHDLATDLTIAFGQALSQASLQVWGVRVTDGTDTAASANFTGTASSAETATLGGTPAAGDVAAIVITDTAVVGSPVTVSYTLTASDTLDTAATALAAAINANAALVAASYHAVAALAVVTIYYPTTDTASFLDTGTTGITNTLASGTGSTAAGTITGRFTGTRGNQISVNITAVGGATNLYNVAVTPFSGGNSELFPNIPGAGFWLNLQNAINKGVNGFRGPSAYLVMSNADPAVGGPTPGVTTLSGGTDGRNVTSAQLLGSNASYPFTGIYALMGMSPPVSVAWIAGLTDSTIYADMKAFADSAGLGVLATFPAGTTTAAALTAIKALGINDPNFGYTKDWVYFYDQANNQTRLVPPLAYIGGRMGTLAPQNSPLNKGVNLVVGTERNNPYTGNQPYSEAEIGQLQQNGILVITNPVPGGAYWGIRTGTNASLDPVESPWEYTRMTNFLANSFGGFMGTFNGQNQTSRPHDPLRSRVRSTLNTFLDQQVGAGAIDSYIVICSLSTAQGAVPGNGINTPDSIAQHFMYAMVKVRYLASVWFFVLALEGGTTTVTVQQAA